MWWYYNQHEYRARKALNQGGAQEEGLSITYLSPDGSEFTTTR